MPARMTLHRVRRAVCLVSAASMYVEGQGRGVWPPLAATSMGGSIRKEGPGLENVQPKEEHMRMSDLKHFAVATCIGAAAMLASPGGASAQAQQAPVGEAPLLLAQADSQLSQQLRFLDGLLQQIEQRAARYIGMLEQNPEDIVEEDLERLLYEYAEGLRDAGEMAARGSEADQREFEEMRRNHVGRLQAIERRAAPIIDRLGQHRNLDLRDINQGVSRAVAWLGGVLVSPAAATTWAARWDRYVECWRNASRPTRTLKRARCTYRFVRSTI